MICPPPPYLTKAATACIWVNRRRVDQQRRTGNNGNSLYINHLEKQVCIAGVQMAEAMAMAGASAYAPKKKSKSVAPVKNSIFIVFLKHCVQLRVTTYIH